MTPERLAELEALANAATPGPWDSIPAGAWTGRVFAGEHMVAKVDTEVSDDHNDAAFIAASRQAIPDLIAALRDAWAERDALAAQVDRVRALADEWEAEQPIGMDGRRWDSQYVIRLRAALDGDA